MKLLKYFSVLSLIAILAGCAPVEEKPIITAPQPTQDLTQKSAQEKAPEPVQEATAETVIVEEAAQDNSTEELPSDKIAPKTDEIIAEATPILTDKSDDNESENITPLLDKEDEVEIAIVEEPKVAPTPPPPPYDPARLIGQTHTQLQALFGPADLTFDNGSLRISHYRQEACVVMIFSQNADNGLITHIDVRTPRLGTALDERACHQALGAKKQNNK